MGCCDNTALIKMLIEAAINEALATNRIQAGLENCSGNPLPRNTNVPECGDVDAKQDPLLDCEGDPLALNTRMATCEQMSEAVTSAMSEAVAQARTDLQASLLSCDGEALAINTRMVTCEDLATAMEATETLQGQLVNCEGCPLPEGESVVTCAQFERELGDATLTAEYDADARNLLLTFRGAQVTVPLDAIFTDLHVDAITLSPSGNMLTITQGDGNAVSVDLSALVSEAELAQVVSDLEDSIAEKQDQLLDCEGDPLAANTRMATCEQMAEAVTSAMADVLAQTTEAINDATEGVQPQLLDCDGQTLAMNTRVVTCEDLSTAMESVDDKQGQLLNCAGCPLPAGESVVTCAELDTRLETLGTGFVDCTGVLLPTGAAVASCDDLQEAIDAIPADKYLQGAQSYDAGTNTLTLLLNDGSTVDVDLTALLADAVATAAPYTNCAGTAIPNGGAVASCADLNAAIAALPPELHVVSTGGYNAGTGTMNLNMNNGTSVPLNLNALITDIMNRTAAVDRYVTGGSYTAANDTLTLTLTGGAPAVSIPLTALINDAVTAAQTATQYADITEVVTGTGGAKTVAPDVAKQRTDIAVFGSGAAANRPSPTSYNGVAIGRNAAQDNTIDSVDTVVGRNAFRRYDGAVMIVPQGANTIYGTDALASFTNAATPSAAGNMTAVGFQTGLGVVGGERSVLVGGAGPNHTAPPAFLSDVVMIGDGAGQIGSGSPLSSVSSYGDICIGRYAGLRKVGATDPKQAGVYIGFNAGQSAYAQSNGTENVFVGAGAGSQSLGGETVAIGNGAYQGGLGYRVVAVGSNAAKNNLASHSTYVGENTRGVSTILGTTAVDTTNALTQDGLGYYLDLPSGSLLDGVPYRIQFYTGLAGTGAAMSGTYTGIAQALPGLDRIYLPRWEVTGAPGEVPYNAANIQSVSLERFEVFDNSTALGRDAIINASNTVFLGNAVTTAVRSTGTFYSAGVALTSDERLKSAISDLDMPAARAFVKGLRFVEYTKHANYIAVRAQLEAHLALAISDKDEAAIAYRQAALDAFDENEVKGPGRREAGLIAQEVKVLAEQHGFEYVVSEDTDGVLSLDYNSIQAIINAVVIDALEL